MHLAPFSTITADRQIYLAWWWLTPSLMIYPCRSGVSNQSTCVPSVLNVVLYHLLTTQDTIVLNSVLESATLGETMIRTPSEGNETFD